MTEKKRVSTTMDEHENGPEMDEADKREREEALKQWRREKLWERRERWRKRHGWRQ